VTATNTRQIRPTTLRQTRTYTEAVLVGRDAERLLLDGLLAGARVGRSGVLVITGEAGIGKTTLLGYARQGGGELRLLQATGNDLERDVPFGGLAQLLRPTPDDLQRIPPPQAQALGVALALREGSVVDRLAVGAAVLSLLTRYSEQQPVGVLIDDAHLLDRPSAEALAFVCRRLLADPIVVIMTARSGEPSPLTSAGLPQLLLSGLDRAGTAELAGRQGVPSTRERLDLLHRTTGGNPLAVRELARHPGGSPSFAPGSAMPVPAALIDWFGRRAHALDADTRTLLLLAATGDGDLAVLSRAGATLELDLRALGAAERADLIQIGPDRVMFAHPLVQASILALAYPDQRRAAHAALADAAPAHDPDRRAWHRCEAALGPDDTVAEEMEAVANRAGRRGAHAVSATAHERSAQLTSGDAGRGRRLLQAGRAAWRAGDGDWAISLVHAALALGTSASARATGLDLEGDIAARRGAPARAHRLFLAAAQEVVDTDPSHAVMLLAEAVSAGYFQGDAAATLAAADRAERLLAGDLTPTAAAVGTLAVGMAHVLAGRSGTELIRTGVRMLDAAAAGTDVGDTDDTDDADAVRPAWLMFGPLYLRESTGRSLVRAALDQGRARSAVSTLPTLLFTIARDGAATQDWADAEAAYGEAIALSRELGYVTDLAMSLAGLSWLEARSGRDEACRAHAAETLQLCTEHPVNTARVWAYFALGELALARGDIPEAVSTLTRLTEYLTEIDLRDPDLSPAPELAEALLRCGDTEQASRLAAGYDTAASGKALPWAQARAARLRGLLGGTDDLDRHFEAALALHARTPDVFEQARTLLAYGSRLRRARRRADARAPLRTALSTFDRLGARPWADAAAAELEATGETAPRVGADDLERLTARELQIALLLAEGRTTRETAAALFLSPKTVEYHLRHVYTKLDITSRTQLVTRLRPDRPTGTI
jgi:DNA-binding CsgD family transcriptional regulator